MRTLRFFIFLHAVTLSALAAGPLLEANRGQARPEVRFLARAHGMTAEIDPSGLVFRNHIGRIGLHFDGARPLSCAPLGEKVSQSNYLAATPPIAGVPEYSSITCREVYPGIDWVVRSTDDGLEHDWIVAPNRDAGVIAMHMDEQESAEVTLDGDLLLQSGETRVSWKAPRAYQDVDGTRRVVESHYAVRGKQIRLRLAPYRHNLPLVIDPIIDFSYMVNGSSDDRCFQVALDGAGNIYIAGVTSSPEFQTTPGAVSGTPVQYPGSGYQLFVRKLSPDGSKTIYSTYLGVAVVNPYAMHPIGLRVDKAGNAYVASDAGGIPVGVTNPIDPYGRIAVYKVAPAGDKLVYATLLSTNGTFSGSVALAIDGDGNAYVAAGGTTVFLSKIDPSGTRRLYAYKTIVSDYTGDLADLALGPDGSAYLAGTISSLSPSGVLPATTGVLKSTVLNPQNSHGYLIRVKPDGSGAIFCTYIAGDYLDSVSALSVDTTGIPYVGGHTQANGKFSGLPGNKLGLTQPPESQAFVMKVTPDGSTTLHTALLPNYAVNALVLDENGQVYCTGPTNGGIAISKIGATGDKLLYYSTLPMPSVYLPYQPIVTPLSGLAIDTKGAAYVAGAIGSIKIPDTLPSTRLLPNGFLIKVDASPDQCDLALDVQADPNFQPNSAVHFLFMLHNNGQAAAEGVVLSIPGPPIALSSDCQASGSGACGNDPSWPRASFTSIPPGGTEQVGLTVYPSIGATSVSLSATVSALTSDVNLDNNSATGISLPAPMTQIDVGSNVDANYTITGASQPINFPGFGFPVPPYATPGSQVQIFWPSPQMTPIGLFTFRSWSDGSTQNPRTFTAAPPELSVLANFDGLKGPYVGSSAVVNSGSYAGGSVAPGELVSLFGFYLGSSASGKVLNGKLTTSLNNVAVSFDGIAAPLLVTSSGQINTIVPYEVSGRSSTNVTIQNESASYQLAVPVIAAVPALFSASGSGKGQAAALNQDGSANSPANPAKPGDIIVLYGTGEGMLSPAPSDGTILSAPAPAPLLPVTVKIGGQPAEVLYAAGAPGQVAGVIQINARIPTSGIIYNHHVPVTWSAGAYVSQDGVTVAVTDSSKVATFQVPTPNSAQRLIAPVPARIAADSDATQITIYGSRFTDGMVARWNGQTRQTQYVDPTKLRVTLAATDLETPGLGGLAVWNAAQTEQLTTTAAVLIYLPILNWDLAYDPHRQMVYAAVAAGQKPQGSSIAVLDPASGRVIRWHTLDAEPKKLALSDDGRYLYVSLTNRIRRIDLNSWTADLDIPLDQNLSSVFSMVTLPGLNTSLVVSFNSPLTAVFDGSKMRTNTAQFGARHLLGGPDANTIYCISAFGDLSTLKVDDNGLTVIATYPGLFDGADGDFIQYGGLIYDSWGTALDPAIPGTVRSYDNQGIVAPSSMSQTVLILGGVPPNGYFMSDHQVLTAYNGSSGDRMWSLALPVSLPAVHGPMFQWGADGVVLREGQTAFSDPAPSIDLFRVQSP